MYTHIYTYLCIPIFRVNPNPFTTRSYHVLHELMRVVCDAEGARCVARTSYRGAPRFALVGGIATTATLVLQSAAQVYSPLEPTTISTDTTTTTTTTTTYTAYHISVVTIGAHQRQNTLHIYSISYLLPPLLLLLLVTTSSILTPTLSQEQ